MKGFDKFTTDWYKKTLSMDEGLERIETAKRKRHDILTEFSNMRVKVDSGGKLCLEKIGGQQYYPTEYAWKKICGWHNMPTNTVQNFTVDFEHKEPSQIIRRSALDAEICQRWFDRQRKSVDPSKKFLYRTYNDGTLRTMVSERYGIIDNGWYLNTLKDLFKTIGGDEPRLFRWRGDEDTIYTDLLIPDTLREEDDSDYSGMLSLGNCEIGKRTLSQYPSVFRSVCSNGCIMGQSSMGMIKKKHVGEIDYKGLRDRIVSNIHTQLPLISEGIDKFLKMKERKVAGISMQRILAVVAHDYKIGFGSKGQVHSIVNEYVEHETKYKSLFGIVNAITRAGQAESNEEWVRFDEIAGSLADLPSSKWEAMQTRAKSLSEVELEEVYGFAP